MAKNRIQRQVGTATAQRNFSRKQLGNSYGICVTATEKGQRQNGKEMMETRGNCTYSFIHSSDL